MTTNNDATRALAKMPEIGTVNKTNVYEWFILHGETIRTALLKSAQVDGNECLDSILQLLTDKENQPHQFVGRQDELRAHLSAIINKKLKS